MFFLVLCSTCFAQSETQRVNISGVISDASGKPIDNALVLATANVYAPRTAMAIEDMPRTRSDSSGRYTMVMNLPEGVASISVFATSEAKVIASRVERSHAQTNYTFDVTMRDSVAPARFHVVNKDGDPIPNAVLSSISGGELMSPLSSDVFDALGVDRPESDSQGNLLLEDLALGSTYRVEFTHPDFARCVQRSQLVSNELADIVLDRGDQVNFLVECIADPLSVPQTTIAATVQTESGTYVEIVKPDSDGRASMRLPDRHGNISVSHPKYLPAERYVYHKGAGQSLKFTLHEKGKVRGKVLREDTRAGQSGLYVQFAFDNNVIAQASIDLEGNYEAEVPAIPVSVGLNSRRLNNSRHLVEVKANETTFVPDLIAPAPREFIGTVRMPNGDPAPGVIVIYGLGRNAVVTDGQGQFRVTDDREISRGIYAMAFHPQKRLSVSFHAGPDANAIDSTLSPDGSIIGLVVDENGKPLPDIPVNLKGRFRGERGLSMITTLQTTRSRMDGTYRFVGLGEGIDYQAEVHGAFRSDYSSSIKRQSRETVIGAKRDRRPIVMTPTLLQEVMEKEKGKPEAPRRLADIEFGEWIQSGPLDHADMEGKSVLLYFGWPMQPQDVLQMIDGHYGDKGLLVIAVLEPPVNEQERQARIKALAEKSDAFSYAIVTGGGNFSNAYAGHIDHKMLLYGSDGQFVEEIHYRDALHKVRNHMLYAQP
ncbi:carboxypeptidase-like regulatory domain-containing protein [Stieleria varia]